MIGRVKREMVATGGENKGDKTNKTSLCIYRNTVISGQKLKVLLVGVRTVLYLERGRQATNERAPPPPFNIFLVGENPTCSVPALWGCEGLSYDYGHT